MKPITVRQVLSVIDGKLIHGRDEVLVQHGAYRIKQVKNQNTIIFLRKRIIDWSILERYFPLIVVTAGHYEGFEELGDLTVIQVNDISHAYWNFVRFYRSQFELPVIAVTGTSGKTTTKEMINYILKKNLKVQATYASNNSRTAHLHYLLGIDEKTEAAVFETAVGGPGDITTACQYYRPTIGIITNIGSHHLNYCYSKEGYIKAKAEMVTAIGDTGVLIVNGDDVNSRKLDLEKLSGRLLTIGMGEAADFQARNVRYSEKGMKYNLKFRDQEYDVFVPGVGEHQVYNSLAAIAAVHLVGVSIEDAIDRLLTYKNFNRQMQISKGMNNSLILDDTWSMTLTSLEAAVKVLTELGQGKKKVAVIGSMTDLGAWGFRIHQEAGKVICHFGVEVLITLGHLAEKTGNYVMESGIDCEVHMFRDYSLAQILLEKMLDEDCIVLFKGDMFNKAMILLAAKLKKS